ncbi:MAG TPA: ABC transporter ATP-binding protein [Acidimicrobiia bacterium]|nr:ABC transporter ATP-binding protein [Acidimicrobiia bacterium]
MTALPVTGEVPIQQPFGAPVITASRVRKYFPIREGVLQRVAGHVRAVDGVSFEVRRGETVGLVGESGCGKTTLGRCIAGLSDPTEGGVYFRLSAELRSRVDVLNGKRDQLRQEEKTELDSIDRHHRVDRMQGAAWREYRRNCQVVFQDAFSSLNPRHLVQEIVGRPLRVYKEASGAALHQKVISLLDSVGLGRQHMLRYPHQFSGGQRQRISIARALALDPEFVVLDEPTSALDVSVQAQILNLLHELQRQRGLTYLFISHDLGVVRHMSDQIVVMYLGEVVEAGPSRQVFEAPLHPYTEALLKANPDLEGAIGEMRGLEGSVPDPARPPAGCRFHTRCPVATPLCGWEVDDAVLWLDDHHAVGEKLVGVARQSAFAAELGFDTEEAAAHSALSLTSRDVPPALKAALVEARADGNKLRIRLQEVEPLDLVEVAPGRTTSCILRTR